MLRVLQGIKKVATANKASEYSIDKGLLPLLFNHADEYIYHTKNKSNSYSKKPCKKPLNKEKFKQGNSKRENKSAFNAEMKPLVHIAPFYFISTLIAESY